MDVSKLQRAAAAGDAAAQVQLATCLYEGKQGFRTNYIEAYKWAAVAAASGETTAKYLVREMELFIAPQDLSAGKAASKSILSKPAKD